MRTSLNWRACSEVRTTKPVGRLVVNLNEVMASTGTGDGTLRLNVVDDDTIQSTEALVLPLGGAGAGNGNFAAGEVYTVSKSDPFVSSITRADASPGQ